VLYFLSYGYYKGLKQQKYNPHTKFEVSIFTHYEDVKGNAKCKS